MAKRKALVLGDDGLPQQLQPGDYLGEVDYMSLTNGEAGSLVCGQPVYLLSADTVKKARANAAGTATCIGLVADTTVLTGQPANIQSDGVMALTTAQWDAVTGGSGGLTTGSIYFLSTATAGAIVTTVPSTGYNQVIGKAISTTELLIRIGQVITL